MPPSQRGLPMSLTDTCIAQFSKEISSVRKSPFIFFIALAVTSLIVGGSLYWLFNWQMWNVFTMKNTLITELSQENDRLKSGKDIKERSEKEEQREKRELMIIDGKEFSHEQVILDGFSYRNCIFANVVFVFNGGPGEIINCTVKAGNNGVLSFNKPVERTIKVLHGLGLLKAEINPQIVLPPGPMRPPMP